MDIDRRIRARATAAAAVAVVAALATAGCADVGRDEPEGSAGPAGGTLTVAVAAPATGINPASVNTAFWNYALLAYEPLLYRDDQGEIQPALAEEWALEDDNTRFTLTLRDDVTFADGTPVDADAVVASLEHCRSDASVNAQTMRGVDAIEASGDLTVEVTLSVPNPLFDLQMTQIGGCGMIISPAGLADVDALTVDAESAGAGAYVYQPAESVAGDHYTYTANPTYYEPGRQHFDEIVLRVIANPQAALSALQTGQVDMTNGDLTTMAQAGQQGFELAWTPFVWSGLNLIDRDGALTPALADARVRQAINLAIDRESISSALLGEYGVASSQPSAEGFDGYVADLTDAYPYDPERARELLAEAGYADGFTLPTLTVAFGGLDTITTAVQPMLAEVGITMDVTVTTDEDSYIDGMVNQQHSATAVGYGSQPMYLMGQALVLPDALPFNGFGTDDPEALALLDAITVAGPDDREEAAQALNAYLVEEAWFAPVAFGPVMYYARAGLGGVQVNGGAPTISLLDLYEES